MEEAEGWEKRSHVTQQSISERLKRFTSTKATLWVFGQFFEFFMKKVVSIFSKRCPFWALANFGADLWGSRLVLRTYKRALSEELELSPISTRVL